MNSHYFVSMTRLWIVLAFLGLAFGCSREPQQIAPVGDDNLASTETVNGILPPTSGESSFALQESTGATDQSSWPGYGGEWTTTKSGGQQRYVNNQWETRASATSEVGATWSGSPGSWTPDRVFQGSETGTTVFRGLDNSAYQNGQWQNWSDINSGLGTQYQNAQNGKPLDSGYQQVQGLGSGLFGVPTGQDNYFAAVNNRFDPTVQTVPFQGSNNSAAIFRKTDNGFQPYGRYDFTGAPSSNFGNWGSQFQPAQLGQYGTVPQNQWSNLGVLFGGLFGN